MYRLSVWFQSLFSVSPVHCLNLPCVFPMILIVFSNSSLVTRLVGLVPCVFKPQSVQTQAIRTLILFLSRVPSTPVILRFLYRHPFAFWFFKSALSLGLSAHLIPGFLTSVLFPVDDSCLPVTCYIGFRILTFFIHFWPFFCWFLYRESLSAWPWLLAWINNDFCIRPGLHLVPTSDVTTL